jgi:hypothetical protein
MPKGHEKVFDARLPGAWVPRELLARAISASGAVGGFGAWIRDAMQEKLRRDKGAHKSTQKCE